MPPLKLSDSFWTKVMWLSTCLPVDPIRASAEFTFWRLALTSPSAVEAFATEFRLVALVIVTIEPETDMFSGSA